MKKFRMLVLMQMKPSVWALHPVTLKILAEWVLPLSPVTVKL